MKGLVYKGRRNPKHNTTWSYLSRDATARRGARLLRTPLFFQFTVGDGDGGASPTPSLWGGCWRLCPPNPAASERWRRRSLSGSKARRPFCRVGICNEDCPRSEPPLSVSHCLGGCDGHAGYPNPNILIRNFSLLFFLKFFKLFRFVMKQLLAGDFEVAWFFFFFYIGCCVEEWISSYSLT